MRGAAGGADAGGSRLAAALAWSASFALALDLLRLWVVTGPSGTPHPPAWYLGLLKGLPTVWLLALLPGLGLVARSRVPRAVAWLASALLGAGCLAAWHYEAVFSSLPGTGSLRYLWDTAGLEASFASHAAPWLLAAELSVLLSLAGGARLLVGRVFRSPAPISASTGRLLRLATLGVVVLAGLANAFLPANLEGPIYWGSRDPFSHLWHSRSRDAAEHASATGLDAQDVTLLRGAFGLPQASEAYQGQHPFCQRSQRPQGQPQPRSVILLLLEGIGTAQLHHRYRGEPSMPALQRIGSEQVSFDHFYAVGTKSGQALPALMAGVTAQTAIHLVSKQGDIQLQGMPAVLAEHGWRTAYFHGGDLSFEAQGAFLQQLGFQELHDFDARSDLPIHGWGWADEITFRQTREWISAQRSARPDQPYLATLATLSTHDPFELPASALEGYDPRDRTARFAASLAYLDRQLEDLYAWYLAEEAPRGTLLLIVSDHTQLQHVIEGLPLPERDRFAYDFSIPFIVAGLPRPPDPEITARVGGQADLPHTLLALLGLPDLACGQGLDLLGDAAWPQERLLPAVATDELRFLYLRQGPLEWSLDRWSGGFALVDTWVDPQRSRDLYRADHPDLPRVKAFLDAYTAFCYLAAEHDAYLPDQQQAPPPAPEALPAVTVPMLVSHRGNTAGHDPARENSLQAMQRALQAGFDWVEADLQLTADHQVVLHHDPVLRLEDGSELPLAQLSLAQLRAHPRLEHPVATLPELLAALPPQARLVLDLKTQSRRNARFVHELQRVMAEAPDSLACIADSFDADLAHSAARYLPCEAGLDLPHGVEVDAQRIRSAVDRGFRWLFLHHSHATPGVVAACHAQGIKAMVYTVDDPAWLQAQAPEDLPDGIITDSSAMLQAPGSGS